MKEKTKIRLARGNLVNMETYKGTDGEIAICEETKQYYMWKDGWQPISTPPEVNMNLNLYDLNVQLVEQFPNLVDKEKLRIKSELITQFMKDCGNEYYLMYGKEISYFTLFKRTIPEESAGDVAIQCLQNIGDIKCIDLTDEKDAIEIWVKTPKDKVTCLYLFPYDTGIVEVSF